MGAEIHEKKELRPGGHGAAVWETCTERAVRGALSRDVILTCLCAKDLQQELSDEKAAEGGAFSLDIQSGLIYFRAISVEGHSIAP